MLYRKLLNWTNLDQTKGLLFFVQRLDELTYHYSLDSYKAPTTCVIALIDEALELLHNPYIRSGNYGAVKHIFDELYLRLKGNFIAKRIFNIDIGSVLQAPLDRDIDDTIRKLIVFKSEMDIEAYLAEIVHAIISHDQEKPKKSQLDLLAKEFASLLQYRGVSREHINNSLAAVFYSQKEITGTDSFREFCRVVYPHNHRFRIGISASKDIRNISPHVLSDKGVVPYTLVKEDFDEDDEDFAKAVEAYHESIGGDELLICFVEAPDANAAATIATQQITEAINFQKLFSHKLEVNISSTAITEQSCCAEVLRKLPASNNHMHFIRDMRAKEAMGAAKRYHKELTLDVGPDARKFNNIFNLHGISLSSTNDDIQIVNLWTCIETLIPADSTTSNISNVVNKILPVLALRYFNRIALTLLYDILRWDRRCFSGILRRSSIDNSFPLFEKFLQLLREEVNEKELTELLSKCRDFELLRYRIANVAELLRDPKKASERLKQHEEVVTWQLYRIYRCRNGIVHTGDSPNHINYLVENCHDYFDQALSFCIEVSSWKRGFNTFESCFDLSSSEYKQYTKKLKLGDRDAIVWNIPKQRSRSFIFQELEQ